MIQNPGMPFYKTLVNLSIPIAIQQLFVAGLAIVDVMLVGQLGDTSVAAVGLATQVYFILSVLYFGMSSGSAIFTAQYWGKNDEESIQQVLSLNIISNILIGVFFTVIAQIFPEFILSLFSSDPQVIQVGSEYLRIFSIGFVFTGISYAIFTVLRSTENVKIPMLVGGSILTFNTLLGYILIFGKLGLPELGVNGAAIANTSARILEVFVIVAIIKIRSSTVVIQPKIVLKIKTEFIKRYLSTAMPVTINELVWVLGISVYTSIYAHIGTESITATNIAFTIENLAVVPFFALGNAYAIIVGKRIGAGDIDVAFKSGRHVILIGVSISMVMSMLILLNKSWILSIYKITETSRYYAHLVLIVLAVALLIKSTNMIMIIGIIRAGGDTRYGLFVEWLTMWIYAVPAAYISANYFHLPVYWVATIVAFEEVIKFFLLFSRYRSKKWIHHLTQPVLEL
jgi:putative MATE family efflux protein